MELPFILRQLTEGPPRIRSLVKGATDLEARWRPDPDSWSMLEVVCHLRDEEREDFRVRLDIILHHPDKPWPPIDPQGWVVDRDYNSQDLEEALTAFIEERERSLAWLEGLEDPDWNLIYEAPFGSMSAGNMLASWMAHDQLHMRQLVELHRFLSAERANPYSMAYAGEW